MDVLAGATQIVKKLNDAGYTAYFAGGWVRDHLMGHESEDIDIATDAPPEKILDLFSQTILVGLAFGVVVVVVDGHQFEVATFRKDGDYADGRKPLQIELSTAEEDASRRDFTINGMFYDPIEHVVHDFVHGAEDLKKRIIRAIGDPYERFVEDRLRMIRAVRFAARFGFIIDPETQEAVIANANTLFPAVALERVWQEITKMSKYPRFDAALIEMHRLKLLQEIFPMLANTHLNEVKYRVSGFKNFPPAADTILFVLELFPQISPSEVKDLCRYLKTSNRESNLAEFLVEMRQCVESERVLEVIDLPAWTHLYAHPLSHVCLEVLAAKMPLEDQKAFRLKHQNRMNLLKKHIERMVIKKPLITATLLQQQGIAPGKVMGTLIKEAERLAIIIDSQDSDEVISKLKETPMWPKERKI